MTLTRKSLLTAIAAVSACTPALFSAPTQANIFKKHPMMTGIAAGMAAHHMAKHSRMHGHHGMMARHPMMTGMAAGMMAHHMAKKHHH